MSNSPVKFYLLYPDDDDNICCGPADTIQELELQLKDRIDSGDLDLEDEDIGDEFVIVVTAGIMNAAKKTTTKSILLTTLK